MHGFSEPANTFKDDYEGFRQDDYEGFRQDDSDGFRRDNNEGFRPSFDTVRLRRRCGYTGIRVGESREPGAIPRC